MTRKKLFELLPEKDLKTNFWGLVEIEQQFSNGLRQSYNMGLKIGNEVIVLQLFSTPSRPTREERDGYSIRIEYAKTKYTNWVNEYIRGV